MGIPTAARDSLVLRGFAPDEILRVSSLSALGARGEPLTIQTGRDSAAVEGRSIAIPHYTILGPLPPRVTVRYSVAPGAREGNSHIGFTGVRFGYAGGDFALLTGRSLFLLPAVATGDPRISVRFALPPSWIAVTPWPCRGNSWLPGGNGAPAYEHLIAATIGLGRFRERGFRLGRTTYRFAFESSIADSAAERATQVYGRAARFIPSLIPRDLGPEYLTVIVPRSAEGDEIRGEPWGTGQGGTLAPPTGSRVRRFAGSLIDAYIRHAPYRAELTSSSEFWLVDGISGLYSARSVIDAGFATDAELTRQEALTYLTVRGLSGVPRNLETLYATSGDTGLAREHVAPFILGYLDTRIRLATHGLASLDDAVRRVFRGRSPRSFWSSLPSEQAASWREFRRRFVREGAAVPMEDLFPPDPTTPAPAPAAGDATQHLTLAFTGNTIGFLENCGCKANQAGGVARRATVLDRIRRVHPATLVVDAGNAFILPERQIEPDYLTRAEQRLYLRAMDLMRYDAAAIGTTELSYGLDWFRAAATGIRTSYLCANVTAGGVAIAPASTIMRVGGRRVAIVGVFEPPQGNAAPPLFEERTLPLLVENPIAALRRVIPPLRRQADLVVVLGRLTPETIRSLVRACPGIDVVVSTEYELPTPSPRAAGHESQKEDVPGFLGPTLVLYTDIRNYGLASADLDLDARSRITSAQWTHHWLYEDVPDHPVVRSLLTSFYDRIGREDSAQAAVPPLFAGTRPWVEGRFVGAERCGECHEAEYRQWKSTRHAGAYKTLLDAHRHYQPRCVVCHVVGYGTRHGYRIGSPEHLLAGVQCESCHGPGGRHSSEPDSANILTRVLEKVCVECHTPDHSERFVYEQRLPRVRHRL